MNLSAKQTEREEATLVRQAITADDRVIEAGGGSGFIMDILCEIAEHVTVFEPDPYLVGSLRGRGAEVVAAAIWYQDGMMKLYRREWWANNSLDPGNLDDVPGGKVLDAISVHAFKLDDQIKATKSNALVLDIEGAEYPVLARSRLFGITKIICELHDPSKAAWLFKEMAKHGFALRNPVKWQYDRVATVWWER